MARLDRFDEANQLIAGIAENYPFEDDALIWNSIPCTSAFVSGLSGDRDGAIDDLEICLNTPGSAGISAWDLYYNPNWDFMRDDPRFVELATPDNLIQ